MSEKSPAVYMIRVISTDELYVGGTRDFSSRKRHHMNEMRTGIHRNPELQTRYDRDGDDGFEFVVLEKLPVDFTDEQILRREQYWMDKLCPTLNSRNAVSRRWEYPSQQDKEHCYAQRLGRPQSQEEKDKRAQSVRQYWKSVGGKVIPEDVKKKTSASLMGRKLHFFFESPRSDVIEVVDLKDWCFVSGLDYQSMVDLWKGRLVEYNGWRFISAKRLR